LVIAGAPVPPGPALSLALGWGADVTWTRDPDRASVDRVLGTAAGRLAAAGRRPYLIPRGGATALGAVGYALAAFELAHQLAGHGAVWARVVTAVGSGGTLAGLVAGNILLGRPWDLAGASASRPASEASHRVGALAGECLALLTGGRTSGGPPSAGSSSAAPAGTADGYRVTVDDVRITDVRGPGHGLSSPEGDAAAAQAMRAEGLLADPVYTAKALALVARCPGPGPVVFWHTGGLLDAVAAAQDAAR
jgi:D-cysteine desulfhydrase